MNETELFERLIAIRDMDTPGGEHWLAVNAIIIDRYAPKEKDIQQPNFGIH